MEAAEFVEKLQLTTGGKVVVKVGDQFFEVQTVYDANDHVMITLGANYLPDEGGGVPADSSAPTLSGDGGQSSPTGSARRDRESHN